MRKYIKALTAAQKSRMPEWRDRWIEIGLRTGEADWDRFAWGAEQCYRHTGLDWHGRVIRVSSPLVACMAGPIAAYMLANPRAVGSAVDSAVDSAVRSAVGSAVGSAVRSAVDSAVDSAVCSAVGSAVDSAVHSAVGSAVRSAVGSLWTEYFEGQFWAGWPAWRSFFREVCGLEIDCWDHAIAYEATVESACYWWPHRQFVMVSQRPRCIHLSDGALHCETGPSIAWDDWCLWHLEGIAVDEQIVLRPETQTVAKIDGEANADVRSLRIARFGWPQYLRQSGARCLDTRRNEVEGTMEALYVSQRGERRLVATCPTGRVFAMGVPEQVANCEQASNFLNPFTRLSDVPRPNLLART